MICIEKNPFSQRRQTVGQDGNKQQSDKALAEQKQAEENSDTDDFDEFYNDKGFLKTGLTAGYDKPNFGGNGSSGPNDTANTNT